MTEFAVSVATTADPPTEGEVEALTAALTAVRGVPGTYLRQLYVRGMVEAPSKGRAVGIMIDAVEDALRHLDPADNEAVQVEVQTREDFEEAGRWPLDPSPEKEAAHRERFREVLDSIREGRREDPPGL